MFRLRLHPTRSGLFFGIAVIAFWALLWLWFFGQLSQPGSARRHSNDSIEVATSDRDGGGRPHISEASLQATAF
ncbi:MAG TPA: hypothetical protein VII08_23740 [Myxococcales bacterium]